MSDDTDNDNDDDDEKPAKPSKAPAKAPAAKPVAKQPAKQPPKPVNIGGESFLDRLIPHVKKIAVTLIFLSVIIAAVFAFRIHRQTVKSEQTAKVADVVDLGERAVVPPPAAGSGSGSAEAPKSDEKTFASDRDRANAMLSEMAKDGVDGTPAFRAGALFDAGKYDEAIAEYKKCSTVSGMDGAVCREGIGLATEAKASAEKDATAQQKGYEAALAAFKAEQANDDGPRAGYAHYHQGRILVLLNRKDEAKKEFEKARDVGKDLIDLPELVRKRLAGMGA
jgi:hypothetical protein